MYRPHVSRTLADVTVRCLTLPDDLIDAVASTKNLIERNLHVMGNVPSDVYIDASGVGEQVTHNLETLIQHLQEGGDAKTPSIAICLLFNERSFLCHLFFTNERPKRKICPRCEWRIDVN